MSSLQEEILEVRQRHFGRGLSLSYRNPLTILRGQGQYLFDQDGKRYLDCVNNVCHVGHCHPQVVEAAAAQMAELNTNTRYLHPQLAAYVAELTARFPDPLNVCYLTCSGSEAVDLALRMARTVTGHRHVLALEAAYHGNTQAAIEVSHYKFSGPGGSGCPPTTRVLPMPCVFRGRYRTAHPEPGASYALDVESVLQEMLHAAQPPAAFIAESMLGVGGQVVLPRGYLAGVYPAVRDAGGLCIADEVQVGFGRCGSHRWAFEMQAVVPDIVTLGKPIGNGHPLAAVITTEEISSAFDNGMEYFNTYGGNPVSCAVGRAVLSIIDQENLQARASSLGQHMLKQWGSLKEQHEIIGDVRGSGLFLGIELVSDRGTLEPASAASYQLVEAMKDRGILLSVDGPFHNVIKFKPPLVFDRDNADDLYRALDEELGRL